MSSLLRQAFREDGYAVDVESLGSEALWRASETDFDAVILDVGLPDISGFEVCRELRGRGRWMPILMLTARDAVQDLVQGLDCGADDYVTKPFELDELRARLRALVRRAPVPRPATLEVGDLVLDPATQTVRREIDSNIVDVYVRMLREKIDRPFGLNTILTVRGAGYLLKR
jgi:two-component system, OmpR family, response regulator